MSSRDEVQEQKQNKAANQAKLVEQMSAFNKSSVLFNKICTESSLALQEPEIAELMKATSDFERIDKALRDNFSAAQLKSTLHELVFSKFLSLEPRAAHFVEKFVNAVKSCAKMNNEPFKPPMFAEFSMMSEEERSEVVKKYQDITRAAVEWRVKFEDLKREWNGEKSTLLPELRLCVQIIKGLCAGLDSNPEYRKDQFKESPAKKGENGENSGAQGKRTG